MDAERRPLLAKGVTGTSSDTRLTAASQDARRSDPERTGYRGTGIYPSVVAGIVVGLALLLFLAQNTDDVSLQWAFWDTTASLSVVVLGAFMLGVAFAVLVGTVWRWRRRRRLREADELERLRAAETSHSPGG
jgi:uncharacterized integral membrane protein